MTWWQYLILANLYLALFYGFYAVLLRKETFFQLNRLYLVLSAVLSFIIPVIQATWVQNLFITQQVKQVIYDSPVVFYQLPAAEETGPSIGQLLAYIYLSGILLLAGKLIFQFRRLRKLSLQQSPVAFSFFNTIKVSGDLPEVAIIASHEEVHARQWHSVDVLLIELISVICWFNPVVYLYRKSIKYVHEFIADSKVVNSGANKANYAMLLLNHTLNAPSLQLANQFFNHSFLKQRIIMLQKNKSARVKLLKYGLSAPLFVLMLILSSATANNVDTIKIISQKTNDVLEKPIITGVLLTPAASQPAKENMVASDKSDTVKIVSPKAFTLKIDTIPKGSKNEIFTQVEVPPKFPGGIQGFSKYIAENLKYPKEAKDKNVQGRVYVTFIVEEDGSISNVKTLRGIGSGCDEEAVRVIEASPKWEPGKHNDILVRVQYTVPISFSLAQDENPAIKISPKNGANSIKGMGNEVVVQGEKTPRTFTAGSNIFRTGEPSVFSTGYPKTVTGHLIASDTTKLHSNTINIQGIVLEEAKPLILLDGEEISYNLLKKLNPNIIESITVLKDKSATAKYGAKGINGVLLIKTEGK